MAQISVIIPAYNCGKFLEKAARSVLDQKGADLELIIVDDGSKDNTAQVCKKLSGQDERVKVISQPNGGVSSARNRGISEATGEYIAFVDADDWLEEDAYSKMLAAMQSSGAECAMCSHYRTHTDGSREIDHVPFETGTYEHNTIMDNLVKPLLGERISANLVLGTVWRFLFRRSRINEMNIKFSGAYLEDEMFLIEYFALPTTLACVDEPLYNYLQNPQSVTRRYLPDYSKTFAASQKAKKELVERYGIPAPEFWLQNSAWAGLLIAVANEFAPGNDKTLFEKTRMLKDICRAEEYADAIRSYYPRGMNRNKSVVAKLLRWKMYFPLALLYLYKNRNRE